MKRGHLLVEGDLTGNWWRSATSASRLAKNCMEGYFVLQKLRYLLGLQDLLRLRLEARLSDSFWLARLLDEEMSGTYLELYYSYYYLYYY